MDTKDTNLTGCRWVTVVRAALSAAAAALTVFALTLVLRKVDVVVPQARDVVLGVLGLALVLTVGAIDANESRDTALDTVPTQRPQWHEYEGSFRGG